jgi:uncharacterized membrane protein YfcA
MSRRFLRIRWSLIACILSGSVTGVLIASYFRVRLLPDTKTFKLFIGIMVLYVGWHLFFDLRRNRNNKLSNKTLGFRIRQISFKLKVVHFKFGNEDVFLMQILF